MLVRRFGFLLFLASALLFAACPTGSGVTVSDDDDDASPSPTPTAEPPRLMVYVAGFGSHNVGVLDVAADTFDVHFALPAECCETGSPRGIAVDQNGDIWLALRAAPMTVAHFNNDGSFVEHFTDSFGSTGLGLAAFAANGDLIVAGDNNGDGSLYRYDTETGALLDSFTQSNLAQTVGCAAGDGVSYGASYFTNRVVRFDNTVVPAQSTTLITGTGFGRTLGMTVGRNSNLFVGSGDGNGGIKEYDGTSGALIGTFTTAIGGASGMAWDEVTQTLFATSAGALHQLDSSGALLGSWSVPELTGTYGVALWWGTPAR